MGGWYGAGPVRWSGCLVANLGELGDPALGIAVAFFWRASNDFFYAWARVRGSGTAEATVTWAGRSKKMNRTGSWHGRRQGICLEKTNGAIGFGIPRLGWLEHSSLFCFLAESKVRLVEARKRAGASAPPLAQGTGLEGWEGRRNQNREAAHLSGMGLLACQMSRGLSER